MKPDLPHVAAVARQLADALERAGMTYAVGGAIAYGYWGVPRATIDVDLTVFVEMEQLDGLFSLLESTGCIIQRQAAVASAEQRGQFSCTFEDIRVDVFLPAIPFYGQVRKRLVTVPLMGRPATVLSAEDLVVFKLLFFRGKDIEDVKRIIATQQSNFDDGYVRHWLTDMLGDDDERVGRLAELMDVYSEDDRAPS